MPRYYSCYKALLLTLSVVSFSACAQRTPILSERSGNYQVSVRSDGDEVAEFEQRLIHRIALSSGEMRGIFLNDAGNLVVPARFAKQRDLRGQVKGLRLLALNEPLLGGRLGLKAGDVVTAIGGKHFKEPSDLFVLYRSLARNNEIGLTLERGGNPHKILYSLEQ
jgi:hypothetical protein